jgi:cysteine desulfurase
MGEAARLAALQLDADAQRINALRDQLWQGLSDLPGIVRHGDPLRTVCSHLNVGFSGLDGETLLMALSGLAVSTGSACNSAHLAPSFVLRAMGVSADLALSSIRFSLGRFTTAQEIDLAIHHIRDVVFSLNRATV